MSGWVVIAFSGVTNGGKGTITKRLMEVLPPSTRLICQDDYFFTEDYPHHVMSPGGLSHFNWDIITSLDMEKMTKDVQAIITSKPILDEAFYANNEPGESSKSRASVNFDGASKISQTRPILLLDGFLLFDHPPLASMCHLKYFFTLSKDECFCRRQARHYDPPDPPGYFDACVWPMYQKYLSNVKSNIESITYLDGTLPPEDIFQKVYTDILKAVHLSPAQSNFAPSCVSNKTDDKLLGLDK